MINRKLFLLTPLFFLALISPVYAPAQDVDLTDFPSWVGTRLGVSTFAGGLICTAFLFLFGVLPIALISRKKNTGIIPEFAMSMIMLAVSVAIGWLPIWLFTVVVLLVSVMYATKFKDMI